MISSLYISLLAIFFVILTIRVVMIRKSLKVSIGDGGELKLQRAIRAHANFCEAAPFVAIMLILAEVSSVNSWILHTCGAIFLIGRILHAISVSSMKENFKLRTSGMILSLTSIVILALLNLLIYVVAVLGLK